MVEDKKPIWRKVVSFRSLPGLLLWEEGISGGALFKHLWRLLENTHTTLWLWEWLRELASLVAPWLLRSPSFVNWSMFILGLIWLFFVSRWDEIKALWSRCYITRPEIEGEIYRVVIGEKLMHAAIVRDFYNTVAKHHVGALPEFNVDVDVLIEMYMVNTTTNKMFVRGFDFALDVDGRSLPLVLQKDFYAYESNDVDFEYCISLGKDRLDRSKLETLKPLYRNLPTELEGHKPLEGWLHFVIKGVDPEKVKDNRNYKLFIVDSLRRKHPILIAVADEREGTITVRPIAGR